MVTIKYYPDAIKLNHFEYEEVNIADFLRKMNKDELPCLRFFQGDILGCEIDTSTGEFIYISEGTVTVIKGDTIPQGPVVPFIPYIIAAIAFVAAIALTPDIKIPDVGNRKQQSATNKLGQSNNEPRVNERIDDIFGFLRKHVPSLWQVPYRIGVNNQEVEVLLLCVGRGKYDIDLSKIYDGDTPYQNIPNASVNIYEPGTHPGNGSPSLTLGNVINEEIGVYRESNDLNPSELLPPNDLALGTSAVWRVSESGGVATLRLTNAAALGVDLQDYFSIGNTLTLIDCAFASYPSTTTITLYSPTQGSSSFNTSLVLTEMSGDYTISDVSGDTVTITGAAWGNFADDLLMVSRLYSVSSSPSGGVTLFESTSSLLGSGNWYLDSSYTDQVGITNISRSPDVGQAFSNVVGPITNPSNSTKVIVNLSSASGFYKLRDNNEVSINATVQLVIEETDVNGVATGNRVTTNGSYSSNSSNRRYSVYKTFELEIPDTYEYSRTYVRRTSSRDKSDNVSNVDKIEWTAMYTFEPVTDVDFGDVTLMHVWIPSNSQSRLVKQRRTNLDVTRKITQYLGDGEFGPAESYPTDDACQIMIHTALDPYNGRLNLNQINADDLLLRSNQITEYFGSDEMVRFGYDFDDSQIAYDDMFIIIANAVNCNPYVQNGVYDAFFERRQDVSTRQITHRNKVAESETREDLFERKYDGVELTYRSSVTGISEVIYLPLDRSATNPERVEYPGCITELQAYRRALRLRNKQIYHVVNVEFGVDEFGRMIVPGERIDSPDGTRFVRHKGNTDGYRIYDGEVVEINGFNIEVSQPIEFIDGEDHYIQFTSVEGDNSELILCTPGETEFDIVLNELPGDSLYDGYQRDKTKFTFCSEQLRESIALIPQTIEFKLEDGQEINTVSSINYDSRYYQGDLETL